MDSKYRSKFHFEQNDFSNNEVRSSKHFLKNAESSHVMLNTGSSSTESIAVSTLFDKQLTESGSFDVSGAKYTSLGRLLLALPIPALLVDKSFFITFCNEAWGRIGGSFSKMEGRSFLTCFPGRKRVAAVRDVLEEVFEERKPKAVEQKLLVDNKVVWARIYFRPLRRGPHERVILALIEDLTLEKGRIILMDKITRAKKEWETTFDLVPDMVALIGQNYRVRRLNAAMANKTGISLQTAVGIPCYRLFHGLDKPPQTCPYARMLNDGCEHSEEYFEETLSSHIMETVSPVKNKNGSVIGCVLVARDITDRKLMEKELTYRATHDILTNLFNRRQMMEMLDAAWQTASRYELPISLCMCDVDNFKKVNDEHGHQSGDQVLAKLAEIMSQELRRADFVGRYAGDEFLIAFPNTRILGAAECLERIRTRFNNCEFHYNSRSFNVTCSFGAAELAPGMPVNELIAKADQLLYESKHLGGNQIVIHHAVSANR